jgi:hypothetical protein
VFGKSTFYPTQLVTTSFVYSGAPFSDAGYEFHSSSNKVIPPAPAPAASTTELLGLNDHGIGDAVGNTHRLLAADEAVSGLAGLLGSSMPAAPRPFPAISPFTAARTSSGRAEAAPRSTLA